MPLPGQGYAPRIIGSQPWGSPRDLEVSQMLALLRQLEAQNRQAEAEAEEARMKARLADPYEAAKIGATVQQFHQRRDVEPAPRLGMMAPPAPLPRVLTRQNAPAAAEMLGRQVRGLRQVIEGDGTPPSPRGVYRTRGPMTELRQEAAEYGDPNFQAVMRSRREQAALHPSVMAAEAYAARPIGGGRAAKKDEDEERFIHTSLPRLGFLAKQINVLGGPGGMVTGAVRRMITGPSQVDELAREFNGIHGALSLALASKLNRGRPTEPDREAAAAILPQLGDAPALVDRRLRLIQMALGDPNVDTVRDPLTGRMVRLRSGGGVEDESELPPSAAPRARRSWRSGNYMAEEVEGR